MHATVSHSAASHSSSDIATAPLGEWIRSASLRLKTWVEACAGAEAALYDQLSRLSDAELERRGISRGELHRCIYG